MKKIGNIPNLKLSQKPGLVMSPQLQQAIHLLQLSNVELSAYIEEQIAQNPLLEKEKPQESDISLPSSEAADEKVRDNLELGTGNDIELDVPQYLRDTGSSHLGNSRARSQSTNFQSTYETQDWIESLPQDLTLSDYLNAQLNMVFGDPIDIVIGQNLIDMLDSAGYFVGNIDQVVQNVEVSHAHVEMVLGKMKSFEPVGVFAQSLKECLTLQLSDKGMLDSEMEILLNDLHSIARFDISKLMRLTGLSKEELGKKIEVLKSLNPKPGETFGNVLSPAIEPDVFIRRGVNNKWVVELNTETLPKVLINNEYLKEISDLGKDESTRTYVSDLQARAGWLIRATHQRANTILNVASEILKFQKDFFEKGQKYMHPLTLQQVAEEIDMHKSTVSRVTANKFVETPFGVFELKYFFPAAVQSLSGKQVFSVIAVQELIRSLLDTETIDEVFSDDEIVDYLKQQDVDVSRRTVSNYREDLGLKSSVERRRQIKHLGFH